MSTIAGNLDITIPQANYTLPGSIFGGASQIVPVWANLKYVPQNGQHLWTLIVAGRVAVIAVPLVC